MTEMLLRMDVMTGEEWPTLRTRRVRPVSLSRPPIWVILFLPR